MREKVFGDLEWVDREGWRRKINLLCAQKDVKTSRICIQIKLLFANKMRLGPRISASKWGSQFSLIYLYSD